MKTAKEISGIIGGFLMTVLSIWFAIFVIDSISSATSSLKTIADVLQKSTIVVEQK